MASYKKGFFLIIILSIFLLYSLNFILSQNQVVVQNPPEKEKKESIFDTWLSFLKSPIFWGAVIILLGILILMIIIFFVVRWIIKLIKMQSNVFYKVKMERIRLAGIQRSYPSKHWLKCSKNTPIRLVKIKNNKPYISSPIAYHRGDYMTHEGNQIICMSIRKKWFFFWIRDLLIVPNKESIVLSQKNKKGDTTELEIDNLPRSEEIVQFNDNEILIYAESISNTGDFFIPVLKAKDKKIIDFSLPVYQSLKDVVVNQFMYEQTDEFTKVAKKSMDINPNLRYETKVKDSNSNVEVPQGAK